MKQFSQNIIDCLLNKLLLHCRFIGKERVIQIIKEHIPFSNPIIKEFTDNYMVISVDFVDFVVFFKFDLENKNNSYLIKNIKTYEEA